VDEQLGKVLEALEEAGLLEDSLLVFCSDHGELLGDHTLAYKWLMYDPITHIPLVLRDTRRSNAGGRVDELVSLIDLGPTILEAAGVEAPSYLEGQSLLPYLEGAPEGFGHRRYVFCEDNYQVMMRGHDYKLVYYIGQEAGELYDLGEDPDELYNLWDSAGHAETKDRLVRDLLDWLAASTYANAGYKRQRSRQYKMRWPTADDAFLHGAKARPKDRPMSAL